ncbi:hypothetical protein SUNI508_09058 [Seiridium unicorne]|uniref:Uncharacterized protein n=1 Tax=Seiridium unicorne TaxID=138068 RepID=A0ABR2USF0_9PEZI
MELFVSDDKNIGSNGGQTWVAEYTVLGEDPLPIEELYTIANEHFNWLYDQREQYQIQLQGSGSCLVSALWIPQTRKVYLATKARGPYKAIMMDKEGISPYGQVWREHIKALFTAKDPKKLYDYHAEDTAYHYFELKRLKDGQPFLPANDPKASTTMYSSTEPNNVMIATWGFHGADSSDIMNGGGRPIKLCDNKNAARGANCQQVAQSLGVYYEITDQPASESEIDSNSDENVDDTNGEGMCLVVEGANKRSWGPRAALGHAKKAVCNATVVIELGTLSTTPTNITLSTGIYTNTSGSLPTVTTGPVFKNTSSALPTVTNTPVKPSCVLQDSSPGVGNGNSGCICGNTTTLPCGEPDHHKHKWTADCQRCHGPAGHADGAATCTAIPSCTAAPVPAAGLLLSNTSIPIGNADDDSGGASLRKQLWDQLYPNCPDGAGSCKTGYALINNVGTVLDGGDEWLTIQGQITGSHYNSTKTRDKLLAIAISGWERAANKSCKVVEYKDDESTGASSCGTGPIKRLSTPQRQDADLKVFGKRIGGGDPGGHETQCNYHTTLCNAPEVVTATLPTPDDTVGNSLQIKFSLTSANKSSDFAEFLCELIIDTVTDATMAAAPELAGYEIFEQLELKSTCE